MNGTKEDLLRLPLTLYYKNVTKKEKKSKGVVRRDVQEEIGT